MADRRPVIVTCAVTGAIHTPAMSPHLPVTPSAIVAKAVAAANAGATILHLHACDQATGRPDQTVQGFRRIVPEIAARTDAIRNLTAGGTVIDLIAQRGLRPATPAEARSLPGLAAVRSAA